ncbi:41b63c63-b057-49e5-92f2-0b6c0abeaaab [Sclerotinia trifoliorum]|uniref:41b63c63-b057-49e5-92f2-0b6c0abeaaab n=1 Tax=Sclerotinia trifoliorum TaxID=28548 RepID=A0A8H2VXQ7_9HELO|nr:41b63c63-b057-49e5-92f2-0b6c0abeaaab [Sclerotinia trifoliorum]
MRLLESSGSGGFSLTEDFGNDIPGYAILSHTWGADTEEVTFKDMTKGAGKTKAGYNKIRLCGEQAERDGIRYFWVDTCCINKSNTNELSKAINSMFRWYGNAEKCYVYLSDVSSSAINNDNKFHQRPWESVFRESRWFTRGWTLQELIAPISVEFFSKDWEKLGNKSSLELLIREITRIPVKALQGASLSDFSITERFLWAEKRVTTWEEDNAYSLLGIFDIYIPLIYGEGRENAFKRLREEINKASKGSKHEDFSIPFSLSNVPTIEQFVGREVELAKMHEMLNGDGSRRTVVLHGLGGMGKTQLSIAYAKRYKDNYSAILWLNIKDEDSLKQSFVKAARQIIREHVSDIQPSSVDMKEDLNEMIDAVKKWLSRPNNTRWLVIYDNYDNPKLAGNTDPAAVDIQKFLPESYQGSVIITTRSSRVGIGRPIQVRKLEDLQDSLRILSNASNREGLVKDPNAIKLAKELDGLPLALATAGAYLNQTTISFSDYIRLYKTSWAKLQQMTPELSSYEDRTLYSTWQISFEHIEQRNGLSAKLLRLWAYFDNQDLWFELLHHSDPEDPDWIKELTKDELNFHDTVRILTEYGLVDINRSSLETIESKGYSIHKCVHLWIVNVLNRKWDFDLAEIAIKFVGLHVPREQAIGSWLTQRRLLQHAARCSDIILNSLVTEHTSTLDTIHCLGILYADQGKLIEAEQMFEQALQGEEKALDPEYTLIFYIIYNLGIFYSNQGKLIKAEQMYERVLQGCEKELGSEYVLIFNTINNLGALYIDQGKFTKAEQMYKQVLQGKEKILDPEHISTLNTINNLGILYKNQGKLIEAEQMFKQVL